MRHHRFINMGKLAADHSGSQNEMAKLHQACKDWGFFQLINHGTTIVIEKMKLVMEDFFKLPLQQKTAYALPNDSITIFSYFCSNIMLLLYFLKRLAFLVCMTLFKLIGANLGVDPDKLLQKVIGLTPQSDATGLTLLIQVNDVQSLQIKKSNTWLHIKPIPGAIIINIGDIMIMSNGEYSSNEHRAIVDFCKERLSIAAFHRTNFIAKVVGPLVDLVKEIGAQYNTIETEGLLRPYLSSKLDGKSLLDHMRINK
ncbi:unnamed protein product [Coffea canephora]|uniref:Fe2OG dioxygenase domain-containing protein n=1 Tax=Coffea canephora TaxID=49390 RepID=A0A068UXH1_COFCA|nr:unnamed protein product [Coffea canephora]